MSHELICAWLGLPAGAWPPDHYRLLGLPAGENDPQLIEERVHQRLDTVRRYQMTHPEPATEAMNRIAQAFVCLSEPTSKRVYDSALLGTTVAAAALKQAAAAVEDRDPLVLVYNPTGPETAPPVRLHYDPTNEATAPPIRRAPIPPPLPPPEAIPVATEVVQPPLAIPVGPIAEAGLDRHGLASKRQLYHRIVQTRRLIDLWNEAGKHLASPKRRMTRAAELNELVRILSAIREQLRSFPPILGEAGQSGNLVLSMVQLTSVPMFQALAPSQRESLTRDWQAGQQVLDIHRDFLRREARAMRKRTIAQRLARILRTRIVEKPGPVLVLLAILAIHIAFFRTIVYPWVENLVFPPAPAKVQSADD